MADRLVELGPDTFISFRKPLVHSESKVLLRELQDRCGDLLDRVGLFGRDLFPLSGQSRLRLCLHRVP